MKLKDTIIVKQPTRLIMNNVTPEIEGGRYPVKACVHDVIQVGLTLFADGHDVIDGNLLYKHESETNWQIQALKPIGEDQWQARFQVEQLGIYTYTFQAWIDEISTWANKLLTKFQAQQTIDNEIKQGMQLLQAIHSPLIETYLRALSKKEFAFLQTNEFRAITRQHQQQQASTQYKHLSLWVDRGKARFSAWYEIFPRSLGKANQHGTLQDLIQHLHYIATLGFDTVYLPPIHPIGSTARKGKNNSLGAGPDEPGCPWAIGSDAGGHTSIHPALGTLDDFKALILAANKLNLEIALDFAFQCSPDHPYLKTHPEWFKQNPDGTLQYAENPPKKYQDIYPFHFASTAWQAIWQEAEKILLYWINLGVKTFRVDNPHTKPFAFWEWLLLRMKQQHPDVIFLAEAFTNAASMYQLSKLGFTQSYTYFTWRNTKAELTQYLTQITTPPIAWYYRPNFWPNTPDILHAQLHQQSLPAFTIRYLLAATLSSNYGIYGPAFELGENVPVDSNSEEYLDSEKYEIKQWRTPDQRFIQLIQKVNQLRQSHAALQQTDNLQFLDVNNDALIAYVKAHPNGQDWLFIIVCLDPSTQQSGTVTFRQDYFPQYKRYQLLDLLTEQVMTWDKWHNEITLNPQVQPACILQIVHENG